MIMSVLKFAESVGPIVTLQDMVVPYLNLINYPGSVDGQLVINMEGPLDPMFVDNLTTRGGAYFRSNFSLGENEKLTINNDARRTMVYSNVRKSLQKFMLPGLSSVSSLRLLPGLNRVSVLCQNPVTDDSAAWVVWRNRFWNNDGAGQWNHHSTQ